jgi:hypothetical protein
MAKLAASKVSIEAIFQKFSVCCFQVSGWRSQIFHNNYFCIETTSPRHRNQIIEKDELPEQKYRRE